MAEDIERCPEDDPARCQAMTTNGQCSNKGVKLPNGSFGSNCLVHGGNTHVASAKKASLRNYQLDKFHAELDRHANSPEIKGLRDEIAILRMTLEIRLNKCADNTDLLLQSGPISDMIMKIERVVSSCHKLEGSMGKLLDKQAILQFATNVIKVIADNISDEVDDNIVICGTEALLSKIGDGILSLVGEVGKEPLED